MLHLPLWLRLGGPTGTEDAGWVAVAAPSPGTWPDVRHRAAPASPHPGRSLPRFRSSLRNSGHRPIDPRTLCWVYSPCLGTFRTSALRLLREPQVALGLPRFLWNAGLLFAPPRHGPLAVPPTRLDADHGPAAVLPVFAPPSGAGPRLPLAPARSPAAPRQKHPPQWQARPGRSIRKVLVLDAGRNLPYPRSASDSGTCSLLEGCVAVLVE